jgi:hypothetical protein
MLAIQPLDPGSGCDRDVLVAGELDYCSSSLEDRFKVRNSTLKVLHW